MSIKFKLATALLFILIPAVSLGQGGTTEKIDRISLGSQNGNFSASLGTRNGNTGWEIGFSSTEDYLSSQVHEGTIPAGAYESLGSKNINGTYGVDVLKFFPSSQSVTLYAGAGAYFQNQAEVLKNGDQLYTRDSDTKVKFAYSGGVEFGKPGNVQFGVGYHSIRGANGQIYIKF